MMKIGLDLSTRSTE